MSTKQNISTAANWFSMNYEVWVRSRLFPLPGLIAPFLKFSLLCSKCSLCRCAFVPNPPLPFLQENIKKTPNRLSISTWEIRALLFHPSHSNVVPSCLSWMTFFPLQELNVILWALPLTVSTMCGQLNPSSIEAVSPKRLHFLGNRGASI